jgi:hypothetical protein
VGRLHARLVERLNRWSGKGIDFPDLTLTGGGSLDPYWLVLPSWLVRRARCAGSRPIGERSLRGIVSGQQAIFLFARLHDDVVDGATAQRLAVYAGDDFLIEAERLFARYVGADRWFWRQFRACVRDSLQAVMEIDERQRRPGAMDREALNLYASASRLLAVGAAAVCARIGRQRNFSRVLPLADELAIAAQILDDLLDIDEDLACGRFNFAANALGIDDLEQSATRNGRLRRAVLIDNAVGAIIGEMERHLRRAGEIAGAMKLRGALVHIDALRAHAQSLSKALHHARVDHLLGPILAGGGHVDGERPLAPPGDTAVRMS